jgi:aminoglycoside 3-N-acetyltransferase I
MSHTTTIEIRPLTTQDAHLMGVWLDMFGRAFESPEHYCHAQPGMAWCQRLLSNSGFIALAAFDGSSIVGGIAAYELMKFEQERSEIYLYDLAVEETHRRR